MACRILPSLFVNPNANAASWTWLGQGTKPPLSRPFSLCELKRNTSSQQETGPSPDSARVADVAPTVTPRNSGARFECFRVCYPLPRENVCPGIKPVSGITAALVLESTREVIKVGYLTDWVRSISSHSSSSEMRESVSKRAPATISKEEFPVFAMEAGNCLILLEVQSRSRAVGLCFVVSLVNDVLTAVHQSLSSSGCFARSHFWTSRRSRCPRANIVFASRSDTEPALSYPLMFLFLRN